MPVRKMLYDALSYTDQMRNIWQNLSDDAPEKHVGSDEFFSRFRKTDKLYPVITIVFYYGDQWDGNLDLYDMFGGDRKIVLARELTKIHEECMVTTLEDALKYYGEDHYPKGEYVLVLEGKKKEEENAELTLEEAVAMAQARKKYGRKFKNVEKFTYSVKDSLFKHLTEEEIQNLRYIPYSNNTEFYLEATILTTESKIVIPTVECRAPYITFLDTVVYRQEVINLVDNCLNVLNKYPGIKFGSMERGNNEAGNWEEL